MNRIVKTDDVMGGQPRIEGRRISVLQIYEWVNEEGMSPEAVSSEFGVELADVHLALSYYYDNVAEMEDWRERRKTRIEESEDEQPSPKYA
ncbi:DUF433 domain-containing protein [Halorussus sp. MSC15.2]|uniref:DUF433 domain-containing protein n=1 Tax=Halorussus sp. MSC15.2 TaxID=2283638 RepID=UPI0013D1F893|nr:DUF433 domain-containing protein [Halorussus sp. MSC15.2]NEU57244.1 DUF433 domain-containing protein [Halorussus sp. MSC15.2]